MHWAANSFQQKMMSSLLFYTIQSRIAKEHSDLNDSTTYKYIYIDKKSLMQF